ncbi:MAG: apolipoprotein N-acyltransferase [Deltaproteobacteria bacterium]|nr:apolipoprotein N-acyltransferase [Deltaproteobacteria bacterium]
MHRNSEDTPGAEDLADDLGEEIPSAWNARVRALIGNRAIALIMPPLVSAFLMALSFPPYSAWGLSFFALVPFLVALFNARTLGEAILCASVMGISIVFTGFYWVSDVAVNFGGLPWIVGKLVLVVFSLFGEMQFLLFGIAAFHLIRRASVRRYGWKPAAAVLVGLPILYTAIDFHYPRIFPNTVGHGLYGWFALAQVAEWTGVAGLTLLMLTVNVAVAALFGLTAYPVSARRCFAVLAVAAAAALAVSGWGRGRIRALEAAEKEFARELRLSIAQANIGDVEKLAAERGSTAAVNLVLNAYRTMSLETKERFHPDVVIWPETAYPLLYTHLENENANRAGAARDRWILDLVAELGTPLIFGGYSTDGRRDYNSIFYVRPPEKLVGVYRKSILLAFGEYVPLGPLAPLVIGLVPSIADFGRGSGPTLMEIAAKDGTRDSERPLRFSPQICYEGIIPDFTRAGARLGADFILNVTNDSWFGNTSEPWIHFWITAFRAIELRVPLVRATNTGFTAVIGVTGKILDRSSLFTPVFFEHALKLPSDAQKARPELQPTFYFIHGEVFAYALTVFAALLLAWVFYPAILARLGQFLPRR